MSHQARDDSGSQAVSLVASSSPPPGNEGAQPSASSSGSPPTGSQPASTTSSSTPSAEQPDSSSQPSIETAQGNGTGAASPKETDVPSASGVAPGVVAGVSIGCVVIGLLAGFLAAWLLIKRRKRRDHGSSGKRHHRHSHLQPHTETVISVAESKTYAEAPGLASRDIQLNYFLLDAHPDRDIASEVRSLGQLIQQHVESHYHMKGVQASPQALAQAAASLGLGQGGSLDIDIITSLAIEPQTRLVAIQHVLSYVLFTSIDFGAMSHLSMLPAPIAAFLQSVPPIEHGQANAEAVSLSLSKWRTLSAFLLHPARSDRTALELSEQATMQQAAGLSSALKTFLGVFVAADERSRSEQRSHLESVIVEVTRLGYLLLSQPSDFRFLHTSSSGRKSGARLAVVCAGLDKLTAKDGTPLRVSQRLLDPEEVTV